MPARLHRINTPVAIISQHSDEFSVIVMPCTRTSAGFNGIRSPRSQGLSEEFEFPTDNLDASRQRRPYTQNLRGTLGRARLRADGRWLVCGDVGCVISVGGDGEQVGYGWVVHAGRD